jgi:hypothetical protein
MIETVTAWLAFAGSHIDAVAVLVGSLVGYVLTVTLERYFLPIARDPAVRRRQRGFTFLVCWLASGTGSALLWWSLEPATAVSVRLTVSYVLGVLAFPVYPVLAAWLTARFPAIGSAWAQVDDDDGQNSGDGQP